MLQKKIIQPAKSPAAVGPYNHAVRVGDLLFCAGQIPIDPANGNLVSGDIKVQTQRVLENVKTILDDQKLTFANVVKSTVFLTNLGDFVAMNEVYAKYFTTDFPARSTIQVSALPRGAAVESIHYGSIAVVDRQGRLLSAAGDPAFVTMTRSALKPFQART